MVSAMSHDDESPSRQLNKFMVRFPPGMRDEIAQAAEENNRSMNAEVVARLERSLDVDRRLRGIAEEDPVRVIVATAEGMTEAIQKIQKLALSTASRLSEVEMGRSVISGPELSYETAMETIPPEERELLQLAKRLTPKQRDNLLELLRSWETR